MKFYWGDLKITLCVATFFLPRNPIAMWISTKIKNSSVSINVKHSRLMSVWRFAWILFFCKRFRWLLQKCFLFSNRSRGSEHFVYGWVWRWQNRKHQESDSILGVRGRVKTQGLGGGSGGGAAHGKCRASQCRLVGRFGWTKKPCLLHGVGTDLLLSLFSGAVCGMRLVLFVGRTCLQLRKYSYEIHALSISIVSDTLSPILEDAKHTRAGTHNTLCPLLKIESFFCEVECIKRHCCWVFLASFAEFTARWRFRIAPLPAFPFGNCCKEQFILVHIIRALFVFFNSTLFKIKWPFYGWTDESWMILENLVYIVSFQIWFKS